MAKTAKKAPSSEHSMSRYEQLYREKIRPDLQKKLDIANINAVPRLEKIVINAGVKEAVADSRAIQNVMQVVARIAGQAPVRKLAKKSIAGFKIREGMPIGVTVTLRRKKMYDFLDKLINLALPKVRDFQGVPSTFDRRGNYNLGIKEWIIFPEADVAMSEKVHGLNITFVTSARTDAQAYELLKSFGMPFVKER
jgi:large subunit ribosomal protein L5